MKPGKGGAFVRTKLKNFRPVQWSRRPSEPTRRCSSRVIDRREMQYLYRDGSSYVFMDNENYDQVHVEAR